ncbi:hypothetical protein P9D28_22240 [Bacillus haynesii]|uniref:hypothetical protein n=1 Tax=Bacillus haynesii TaxID=1925021 RepID=UPI002DBB90BF|nr:hypothetical protein [Bacillus haynesii]MEC1555125.1 hypothetical protein [Bacillus haynesii]
MSTMYNYYRSELKSKNVARYKIIGITTELLLDTNLFNKNEEIVPFLRKIYKLSFKDYIIKSRTLIIARISREIYKLDSKEYDNLRKSMLVFLNNYLEFEDQNKSTKNGKKDFTKWMDGITDVEI